MNQISVKKLTATSLAKQVYIAILYVSLTLANATFSYREVQFRISEILILLIYFNNFNLVGLTLGCFVANLFSPLGVYDIIFGTMATLISGVWITALKDKYFLSLLFPVLINGIVVAGELEYLFQVPFMLGFLSVSLGEAFVLYIIGIPFYFAINKIDYLKKMLS